MKINPRIFLLAVLALTGLFVSYRINQLLVEGENCEIALEDLKMLHRLDLQHEVSLRTQAEDIKIKLIEERADEWCSDSIDQAWDTVELLEKDCAHSRSEIRTELVRLADLWDEYVNARIKDCKSRNLKTTEARIECLGPAFESNKIHHAIEAMMIHQESKVIEGM